MQIRGKEASPIGGTRQWRGQRYNTNSIKYSGFQIGQDEEIARTLNRLKHRIEKDQCLCIRCGIGVTDITLGGRYGKWQFICLNCVESFETLPGPAAAPKSSRIRSRVVHKREKNRVQQMPTFIDAHWRRQKIEGVEYSGFGGR